VTGKTAPIGVVVAALAAGWWGCGAGPQNGDSSVQKGDAAPTCAGESGSPSPSCAGGGPGMGDCGSCKESCCASLTITGGTYDRTYSNAGEGPSGEAAPATVSSLRLDKYEVTVGRFRQFVSAWNGGSAWRPPSGSGKHAYLKGGSGLTASAGGNEPGWDPSDDANIAPTDAHLACDSYATWTSSAGDQENLPINCVNWYEAYAFCIWDGGFLPSEAEWEYAAAGGSQQREYPWGSTDPGTGNQFEIYDCYYPNGSGRCTSVVNVAPVGTATQGTGLWGQLDLAGNVEEWTLDDYVVPYAAGPCTDCAYLTTVQRRALRGGNFFEARDTLLPPYRDAGVATNRSGYFGIRCARNPL
jgi:formylglycine-generating enzyme